MKCSVDSCTNKHFKRGFCQRHYGEKIGTDELPLLRVKGRVCSVEGCDKPHEGLGYCKNHRRLFLKYGDPLHEIYVQCSVDGCTRRARNNDICKFHAAKVRKFGTVDGTALGPRQCIDCQTSFEPRASLHVRCDPCRRIYRWGLRAKYYANDPEKYRERCREWRRNNTEHRREYAARYSRDYYKDNSSVIKARVAEWKRDNADRVYETARRRRAQKKGADAIHFSPVELEARMSMFGFRCWVCGGPFEHIDHIKPLSKGGIHVLCNLRPACADCNIRKRDKWPFTPNDATWLAAA